jgi:DNA-binding XRE family transcriptional regulator
MDFIRLSARSGAKEPFPVLAHSTALPYLWSATAAITPSTYISDRFGVRLRALRKERDLTQLDMATEFGIDRSFISELERGKTAISLTSLQVIATGFGLTLSELLSDI